MFSLRSWKPPRSKLTLSRPATLTFTRHLDTRRRVAEKRARTVNPSSSSFTGQYRLQRSQQRPGPRNGKSIIEEQQQQQQPEHPEITLIRDKLRDILNRHSSSKLFHLDTELAAINAVVADYRSLIQAEATVPVFLGHSVLKWLCTRDFLLRRYISRNPETIKIPGVLALQERCQNLIEQIWIQHKQGKTASNVKTPILMLHYYGGIMEYEKALEVWEWHRPKDMSMSLRYDLYLERIKLSGMMGEDPNVCESLYEEAITGSNDSLTKYHISHNAVLDDSTQPVALTLSESLKFVTYMAQQRLQYNDWINGYLTLDTSMRLDPQASTMRASRMSEAIQRSQSDWQSLIFESSGTFSACNNATQASRCLPWLQMVLESSKKPDISLESAMSRIEFVALAVLKSIEARFVARLGYIKKGDPIVKPTKDSDDLALLWNCWFTLAKLRGKEKMSNDPLHRSSDSIIKEFIVTAMNALGIKGVGRLKGRISDNMRLISKLDGGEPYVCESSSRVLDNILARVLVMQKMTPEEMATQLDYEPFGSGLVTRADMLQLYHELGHKLGERQETDTSSIDEASEDEFVYRTSTGIPFEEARFRNWMLINNLFLAGDAFEQEGCLACQQMQPEIWPDDVVEKQIRVIEALAGTGQSEQEKLDRKQTLLDKLREFRTYKGDSTGTTTV